MLIDIKLDKNFTTQFNKMQKDYGEAIAKLNGFSPSQLNYTDFIDNFVDKNTVADTTIDGNANVGTKDTTSLTTEMSKPHRKLLAFNKIFYDMNKIWGYKDACDWLKNEWTGKNYLHDSHSSTEVSYSYKGTELVVVKYKEKLLLASFCQLYDLVEEPITLLCEEDEAFCKYTNDLFVLDANNTWTKVIRVIRKPKTNDFHFIKSSNGMTEIVTSNHPVITTKGDKNASNITTEDFITTEKFEYDFGSVEEIFCLDFVDKNTPVMFKGELFNGTETHQDGQVCYFSAVNPIQNRIKCDFEFGWFVGIIIAEGSYKNDNVLISQNKGDVFDEIIRICEKRNFGYHIRQKENSNCFNIVIKSKVLADVISNAFSKKAYSYNKTLNPEILNYNKEFIKGIVSGVLDGDGTLTQAQGRRIHIRMTSRTIINQIAFLMRMFGYTVREQTPTTPVYHEDALINQRRYVYHVAFTPYSDIENFDSIKIRNHNVSYTSSEEEGRYTNGKYTFGFGEKQISNNVVLDKDTDEYVYDISVETGHFMCNGILSHNCYAYDIERLATEGLYFIDHFNNQAPQHLTTYTDFVGEFVSWTSNRSSGACGLPSFLIYSYYFWKKDVADNYFIRSPEYYREQEFQRIIYKLNQPYLRVNQSAFTNFSIFDRDYLVELFGGKQFPDGSFIIDDIEEIIEYQKSFMRVVSRIRESNMMTFPVLTFALLKKDGKWGDEEFAKWCCKHNMKWADSNFFISDSVTSLSNCCLSGDTVIKVKDKITGDVNIFAIETFVSQFNNKDEEFLSKFVTNFEILSYNYETEKWEYKDIEGLIRKKSSYDFMLKFHIGNRTVEVTPDHKLEVIVKKTGEHCELSSIQVYQNIGKYRILIDSQDECVDENKVLFSDIDSVERVKNDSKYVYCIDVKDNHNFNANGVNVGNCRLQSDIKELGYFNSIGGTALEVGSVKVNTVNLARIAYENARENYMQALKENVITTLKCLDTVRHIIQRNVEKNLLPNYALGIMHMESQYNTIGVIGVYEVLQKYGMIRKDEFGYSFYTDEGIAFAKELFDTIIATKEEFRAKYNRTYKINIEQIPAERAAVVLMNKDQYFFPDEKYELPTYGNQWIPLAVRCTLEEKIRISALLDTFCNGGSIAHINLESPFTDFDQAWEVLNYVADSGVKYFAFCVRISACKNNHGFFGNVCPHCGEPKVTSYQRIVGFLVPERTYSQERKKEFAMRDWFDVNAGYDLTAK